MLTQTTSQSQMMGTYLIEALSSTVKMAFDCTSTYYDRSCILGFKVGPGLCRSPALQLYFIFISLSDIYLYSFAKYSRPRRRHLPTTKLVTFLIEVPFLEPQKIFPHNGDVTKIQVNYEIMIHQIEGKVREITEKLASFASLLPFCQPSESFP